MIYHTAIGDILLKTTDEALIGLHFLTQEEKDVFEGDTDSPSPILRETSAQLDEYFAGKRRVFSVSTKPAGTTFMQEVWDALMKIPYGQTRRYGEIAASIGRPTASRAVGMACNRNPIALIIPCHRVIGAKGDLVGFRGGVDIKEKLLALESEK
ncbi:MAG: methylated-DNA--[protein]-cysteine S-methyltransferase [Methanomicrobiales archaeon]|jgi:methylated-DNA-[protein]-cysteine S-methyltransferase|nr:methylated-DNA--[protein]-cysteine S-methyltransferase [Methanomicrobiales archaeon]